MFSPLIASYYIIVFIFHLRSGRK